MTNSSIIASLAKKSRITMQITNLGWRFNFKKLNGLTQLSRSIIIILCFIVPNLILAQDCNNLPSFDFTFTNNSQIPGQIFNNKNIRITGTVTFTSNVAMNGCTVLLDPESVIQLSPGVKISAANSNGVKTKFFGCGSMWSAIRIRTGNTIQFIGCIIQDGISSIQFSQGYVTSNSYLINCQFKRNFDAITANDIPVFTLGAFSGNVFDGEPTNTLPPFDIGVAVGQRGIFISNSTGSLGTSGKANRFTNLSTGIRIQSNSTMSIKSALFEDNVQLPGGIGIDADQSSLSVIGTLASGRSCIFNRNNIDIRSSHTRLFEVQNAVFSDPKVGSILIRDSDVPNDIKLLNSHFTINSNSLLPTQNLVEIERAAQSSGTHIDVMFDTIVVLPATFSAANNIRLMSFTSASNAGITDVADIRYNEVHCSYGNPSNGGPSSTIDAFVVSGKANNYQIAHNNIFYDEPLDIPNTSVLSVAIGILNNSGTGNAIVHNTGIGRYHKDHSPQTARDFLRCGVHTVNTPKVFLCYNDFDQVTNMYHFNMDCSAIKLGRNKLGTGDFGLVSDGINSLPLEYPHGQNEWLGDYNTNSARHASPPSDLKWTVDPSVNPLFMPPQPTNPVIWFKSDTQGNTQNACAESFGGDDPETGKIVADLVEGKYSLMPAVELWDFEHNLMYQMVKSPTSLVGNPIATQYYTNRYGNTIWQLANAQLLLENAQAIAPQQQTAIDNLFATASSLIQQVYLIDSLPNADSLLQLQKAALLLQLSINQQNLELAIAAVKAQRLPLLGAVLNYIDNIATSNNLEQAQKAILLLIIKRCLGQDWLNSEHTTLHDIAYDCKEHAGKAVGIAREMLPDAAERNQFGLCGLESPCLEHRSKEATTLLPYEIALKIFPNPANDVFTLQFEQPFSGQLQVYDANGGIVLSKYYTAIQTTVINTSQLSNGVYILKYGESGKESVQKIVVAH
jgi:hypothetical protein